MSKPEKLKPLALDTINLSRKAKKEYFVPITLDDGQQVNIRVREFGNLNSKNLLIPLPGITRNGRDFTPLARYLAKNQDYRIICQDIVGRGESSWLTYPKHHNGTLNLMEAVRNNGLKHCNNLVSSFFKPNNWMVPGKFWGDILAPTHPLSKQDEKWQMLNAMMPTKYNFQVYEEQVLKLMQHLNLLNDDANVTLLGVSMGGIVAQRIAARVPAVKRLILDDVAPEISFKGIADLGIVQAAGKPPPVFNNFAEAKKCMKDHYGAASRFGHLSEHEWDLLTAATVHKRDDGRYERAFDPALIEPFEELPVMANNPFMEQLTSHMCSLWPEWEHITQVRKLPVLVVLGEHSLLVEQDTIAKMAASPNVHIETIPGVGHAPMFLNESQQKMVERWLQKTAGAADNNWRKVPITSA